LRSEAQRLAILNHIGWENVPSILGENISDEKVNVFRTVRNFEPIFCPHTIIGPVRRLGAHRFDLNAPKRFLGADKDVVTFTVSPRFGDAESNACSLAHKSEFGEFTTMLIVEFCCVREFVL
jgi:hypothetical protein